MVAPLAEADLRARWVLHEAPLFELPHVVHGGQRDWLFGPMLAAGPDSPLISIAAPVHPSATASPMAVFTVCASRATLQVMDCLMVRCGAIALKGVTGQRFATYRMCK